MSELMGSVIDGEYRCNDCNYSTTFKGNLRKHLSTAAHQMRTEKSQEDPVLLAMEVFMKHQSEQLKQQSIQNTEMFRVLAASLTQQQTAVPVQNVMIDNTQNNNNTTKFNLNLFLNEECKNAVNISDFIKSVVISMEDLEHIGEVGYTAGMSKILSKAMVEHPVRPLHCTDLKRETMYVRKNDAWQKDTELEETKRLIQHVAHKNYKALSEWREQHPEHMITDSPEYEAWYSISRNICNTDTSALNKLVRHLATVTAVKKD